MAEDKACKECGKSLKAEEHEGYVLWKCDLCGYLLANFICEECSKEFVIEDNLGAVGGDVVVMPACVDCREIWFKGAMKKAIELFKSEEKGEQNADQSQE